MPAKNRQIDIKKYINTNWIVKITNETTVQTVANQSWGAFNESVNKKFLPLYEKANQIENPRQRRAAHKRLDKQVRDTIKKHYANYQRVTLNSLSNATLGASRIQYQLLEQPARKLREKRAGVKKVQKTAQTRELQLGTGSQADPRRQNFRHKGSSAHVINRLAAGHTRDLKKVGVNWSATQFIRRTHGRVQTVARTLAQGTIADADQQAIRETFDKYRYVSIIDENTTDRCDFLDGEVFEADDAEGIRPPQHFNCRSELQPVSRDKDRDRALRQATKTRFEKWLKDQPDATQQLIVGKANMAAYRAGKYHPKPEWKMKTKFYVDPSTGQPVVPTKENISRLEKRTKLVDVNFAD